MIRKIFGVTLSLTMVFLLLAAYSAFAATSDSIYQAENATIGKLKAESTVKGFSGKGYVNLGDGPSIDFKVNVSKAGTYPLVIHYALPTSWGSKQNNIIVNGKDLGAKNFAVSDKFTDRKAIDIDLNKGDNTVSIKKNWGYIYVDYIKIVGGGDNSTAAASKSTDTQAAASTTTKAGVSATVSTTDKTSTTDKASTTDNASTTDKASTTATASTTDKASTSDKSTTSAASSSATTSASTANPKTGDTGVAPYVALIVIAGAGLWFTRKKWVRS